VKVLVMVERAAANWSAYAPDVPGCVATGATREEALANMRGALDLHLRGMREDGEPLPEAVTSAEVVEVPAA
jgi:predicted RNase H-like HicB family nuclease